MKKVAITVPVEIALRTLGQDDQRQVLAWLDHLRNWEEDEFVRAHSHRLGFPENTYVLKTNTDLRIFFTLEGDTITVLDIARRKGILTSAGLLGEGGQ